MSTFSFIDIADQVKLDLIPKNHAEVNTKKRLELARTFIGTCIINHIIVFDKLIPELVNEINARNETICTEY